MAARPAELLFVVGMPREARIVGRGEAVVVRERGLAAALAKRPTAVVSFGICGALDPDLEVGAIIVGSGVTAGGEKFAADRAWATRLLEAFPGSRLGGFVSEDLVVGDPAAKAALRRQSGAMAVDMESHLVARTGLPFAVLRAVSDRANQTLPSSALAGFRPDGTTDIGAVLRALASHPGELAALLRLAAGAATAFKALEGAPPRIGAAFRAR
jgi:hopanoid-associated phosphorylase